MMQIIPVIDLLNGVVVHAKQGDRKNYQAIQSQLTSSSKPLEVVSALIDYYPFQSLYIADLNAIQKLDGIHSSNYNVIASIAQRFPALKIWIDSGVSNESEFKLWQQLGLNLVLGSESFNSIQHYLSIRTIKNNASLNNTLVALSLDFMPNGFSGPVELLNATQYWPKDVIMMSLANVGANQGINLELLDRFRNHATNFNLYAAGGVRNEEDLILLKQAGFYGALIATALHQKQLSHAQINALLK